MLERVEKTILSAIAEVAESVEVSELVHANKDTFLFGSDGCLDSLGIVLLVTEVEEAIFDEFNVDITLADDRAMSQKSSPFISVNSLVLYTVDILSSMELKN